MVTQLTLETGGEKFDSSRISEAPISCLGIGTDSRHRTIFCVCLDFVYIILKFKNGSNRWLKFHVMTVPQVLQSDLTPHVAAAFTRRWLDVASHMEDSCPLGSLVKHMAYSESIPAMYSTYQ